MLTQPAGLSDADVAGALRRGWGIGVDAIVYAPLGFGSHHWWVESGGDRWFVTVDDLELRRLHRTESVGSRAGRLDAALSTARSLRDAGLRFVVAPEPTSSGGVIESVGGRFAAAVYPPVDGEPGEWGPYPSRGRRLAVADLLVELHGAAESTVAAAHADGFAIAGRDELHDALHGTGPWDAGPYGERARSLLAEYAHTVAAMLDRFDELAAAARGRPQRFVPTHGEPHPGNTITTDNGVVLVDWDTVLLAPPERDLWLLADEDPSVVERYTAATGTALDSDALELYRLAWDLDEVAGYVAEFRRPHLDTDDTWIGWNALVRTLDSSRPVGA